MTATAKPLRRAMTANSAAADFTAKIPTATKPSGTGVFDMLDTGLGIAVNRSLLPQYIQLVPFGSNANDETFDMRLWSWSQIHNPGEDDHEVWVPQLIAQLAVTLGNIAATALGTDHFLADTIAVTDGDADAAVISPANDTTAHVLLHFRAGEVIEFDFDLGTAAGANCLWRTLDHP